MTNAYEIRESLLTEVQLQTNGCIMDSGDLYVRAITRYNDRGYTEPEEEPPVPPSPRPGEGITYVRARHGPHVTLRINFFLVFLMFSTYL